MEKGLDVFADAMHELDERGVPHRMLIIGEGPARPWFEQQLPGAIFLGEQTGTDLARALASADILLNPSITEAFGNVTLEAMACGLPVVAANATGATNLVRHGHTGMLVEASDIDGFADALERYVRDPERRARHGAAGLKVARTMDWDHINSAVIKTYIRAISKRERIARITGR
jgi:glycosyltransferase involved in cell wall biosynthesis